MDIQQLCRMIERDIEDGHQPVCVLELLAPVTLNVVCFRYRGVSQGADLNKINAELLLRLQESGQAVPSGTTFGDCYALHATIVNHRSRFSDFEALVQAALKIGRELI
jgi:glutamate/tyrosine decarboxylase-like PLP-dependent enzyme